MNETIIFLQWYGMLFGLGLLMFPVTALIFSSFADRGYIFSKIIAAVILSYVIFLLGTAHILPFTATSLFIIALILIIFNGFILKLQRSAIFSKKSTLLIVAEECMFFAALLIWTYIRGHEPSINGLEKFMDFGFINSILRTQYFPPTDMWFPPHPINYYYFGHLLTAVLTKISLLSSNYTYNLMVSTIFAFTVMGSFSIGYRLSQTVQSSRIRIIVGGILSGLLVGVAGNMHMIYAFFVAYTPAENPVPFWHLAFKPFEIFSSNGYWYPNATRFIPNTIHEFPLYSFVVSDLHGHVLDIPVVLLFLALLLQLLLSKSFSHFQAVGVGFILSIMYMTNVLDFGIYFLVTAAVAGIIIFENIRRHTKTVKQKTAVKFSTSEYVIESIKSIGTVLVTAIVFSLPFSIHFKPFASGIGILCGYELINPIIKFFGLQNIINSEKIGPFLFEPQHCQHSEWWMLLTLYGFFYFFVAVLGLYFWRHKSSRKNKAVLYSVSLAAISTIFIIIPEFAYIKDIYPDHYRANTMFKLTYQSFMMLSLVSAFVISSIIIPKKNILLSIITVLLLSIVLLYPKFAIYSYYNNLQEYSGIDGTVYLKERLPEDYQAIQWINKNISGQPVMVEAQGDSYTDYERISANTGLPTVLGWTVHEWLWRGSYEIPAPRITDVQTLYETTDLSVARGLLEKYNVEYIYIGNMEREKYPNLSETKFTSLGAVAYRNSSVKIYKISQE